MNWEMHRNDVPTDYEEALIGIGKIVAGTLVALLIGRACLLGVYSRAKPDSIRTIRTANQNGLEIVTRSGQTNYFTLKGNKLTEINRRDLTNKVEYGEIR
jgi:hypothetical protein